MGIVSKIMFWSPNDQEVSHDFTCTDCSTEFRLSVDHLNEAICPECGGHHIEKEHR
jgi:rRNA maturation endonuclease Nob1